MIRRIAALLTVPAILALLALAVFLPADSPATGPVLAAPSATTPSYPPCVTEDGAGQALCMWDAHTMGNGEGSSVLSGDCAPAYVGGYDVSAVCVALYAQPSSEHEYQGATITVPNGADLVGECLSIETSGRLNADVRNELNSEGWSLLECFKASF